MTEDDPQSEETIFSAALRCALAQRSAFLDEACAGQPALRQRIEQLLQAQLQIGGFMEAPANGITSSAPSAAGLVPPPEETLGSRIGHYRLLQKIGEGGCGVVYMAEQEEPVRRRVAVKVIKLGMDTKSVIARFEAERQALAIMDHPNIAKVLDAGATETGRPYFVMELVRGSKITEFCDQNRLSTTERLTLVTQVCQAVQHAHQKGIIHRDLKPSNILVTVPTPGAPGVPIIIDFGIAKATQGRLTDQTFFTAFEQFLGTPAYMSPEQAMMTSLDIDTRSDIYSLGVLLYELLTGRTPFDPKELLAAGFEEMRRTIREKEPPRPSTRLSTLEAEERNTTGIVRRTPPPKLVQLVRGDLDWIVMKCLEKDRGRRYETASALASDLQRHLNSEPILARPPSRLYEFQKTVRRHKVGFTAVGTVLVALTAGIFLSSREAGRARRAELQTRHTAYVADMGLANQALTEEDLGTARSLLRRYWPAPRENDLRNWEWRHLAKACEGDPHFSLTAHTSPVWSLRFLNGKTLLTTGIADWRTILWNLEDRRPSIVITNLGRGGGVSEVVAVSPKRNRMFYRAAWRYASRIEMVDLERGTEAPLDDARGAAMDLTSGIESLDISPDEDTLAVASGSEVGLWSLDQSNWRERFKTEEGAALLGLFSSDGETLVVADDKGHIAFWNLTQRRKLGVLSITNTADGLWASALSRNGRWLATPGGKQPTRIWNARERTLVAELMDSSLTERAAFSPDSRWLATIGGDATVRLWNTSSWRKTRTLRGHTDSITSLDFSPDGSLLATGTRNGEVKLWSLSAMPPVGEQAKFPPSTFFQLAADGSGFGRLLQAGSSPSNHLWSAEYWTTLPLQRALTVAVSNVQPSIGVVLGDRQGIVLGGEDGSLRLIGAATGSEIVVDHAHAAKVYLMDASLDGSTLATKGLDGPVLPETSIRIWRLPRLEPIAELPHAYNVHSIKLSDDGRFLAGFTGPGDMGVWEIPSMKGPPMWRGVAALQRLTACAFSPDNRWLAATTPDGGAFVWNLSSQRRMVLPRAATQYTSLSFSPDGTRLVAGSEGEAKLFDTASGQTVLSIRDRGLKLAFTRDGERLLAVHEAGASVLHAPSLEKLQFDWLKIGPSQEAPPYRGPNTNYERPDRF